MPFEINSPSGIVSDLLPLDQALETSRFFDAEHGAGAVEGVEALLAAERRIACASMEEAEGLVRRVAFPGMEGCGTAAQDHLWAGLVLMQHGKNTEAAACFEQSMTLGIQHWRVSCYLALALGKSGNRGEAFLALNEARQVAGGESLVQAVQQELLDSATPLSVVERTGAGAKGSGNHPTGGPGERFRRYEEVRSRVETVEGYLCPGQEEFLFNKVCSLPDDAVIVEIGSFKGRSTVAMGLACLQTARRLLCIDTWDVKDWEGSARSFPAGGTFDIWRRNVSQNGLDQHVVAIRGGSQEVLKEWRKRGGDRMIDFIFIDGSHEYENVLRDFELVLPWVRPGGWIAFHDVVEAWPGPHKVWHEHASLILESHEICSTIACGRKPLTAGCSGATSSPGGGATLLTRGERVRNFIISGTNYWNPGDDFVRDGVIQVLRQTFPGDQLNFHFYNFAEDQFPKSKFRGIGNEVSAGDLEMCRDFIDGVIVAGLSAGHEIKDLYNWVLANGLEDRVFLIGGGYENSYCAEHVLEEPEATIFRKARIIIGRTASHPGYIRQAGARYVHLNCPALLSVPEVKTIVPGKRIERIGFSIQLPHEIGLVNQSCARKVHELACELLFDLARTHRVELVAHHKSEYFHFLRLLKGRNVPVVYSSFYGDLHEVYRRYDCVITTRLHSSLYANGHGIPGIIINDTDRHTHTLAGFPHSAWVNRREDFERTFARFNRLDLAAVSAEMERFKSVLAARYVNTLRPLFRETAEVIEPGESRNHGRVRPALDKLNVGCGYDYREGYVNVDGNGRLPRVDVVLDVRPGILPVYFAEESFRNIVAKDFLEHHTHWEAVQLLNDFAVLLEPCGELELFLPNVAAILNDPHSSMEEKRTWLYGGQDITQPWETDSPELNRKLHPQYFCHKFGWTPEDLRRELAEVGFERVTITDVGHGWNMRVQATKPARIESTAGGEGGSESATECGEASVDGVATYRFDSERKEQLLVRSRVKPGMTVLDVGAHLGKYTKLFSLIVGGQGRVYAFEPTPGSASKLAGRIASDGLDNVTLVRQAVCDRSGIVMLHEFPEEYSSWNGLGRPEMEDPRDTTRRVPIVGGTEVVATTLDEFCQSQGITRIDYLKLDVEGAEIQALRGAQDLLSRQAIHCLQFEVSRKMIEGLGTRAGDVFDFLASHGYRCHSIREDGSIGPITTDSDAFYDNYVAFPVKVMAPMNPAENLPIHFFTIVLNGEPFIRHHIEMLRQLPCAWHWHIVEGVAELRHDTSWSVAAGGRMPEEMHARGLSIDGTSQYLDALKEAFPDRITIYRPPAERLWDGKREMVNAPLGNIPGECLLWQLDADELWTATQVIRCRALFLSDPAKTAALFYCHYFVGPDRVITSRDTYGNHSSYEWLRVWRYRAGDRWVAHEPPRLGREVDGGTTVDVGAINPITHADTESMGLVFQHFAYATEAQVRFKQDYYGYSGAVAQWEKLQAVTSLPCRLGDYFGWVKDGAMVDSVAAQRIEPLVRLGKPEAAAAADPNGPRRILFVRTDSIGDAVLAASMLEPIARRYPDAQLAVLCQRHMAELYGASPYVHVVICYERAAAETEPGRQEIIHDLARYHPDLILNSVRSRDALSEMCTHAFPGARRIGIESDLNNTTAAARDQAARLYDLIIPSTGELKPELAHHATFLRGLGIPAGKLQPVVWTSECDEHLAEAFFEQHNLEPLRTMAVFPCTQHGIKDYAAFAPALAGFGGWSFLVLGGAESEPRCEELVRALPGPAYNLASRTTLREMAALIRRCRILVGSDSCGPHIACAVGVPNVVVVGGGHLGRFMPYSGLTSIVALPLPCSGCNWSCKFPTPHCVRDIAPELVADAIDQALQSGSRRARVFLQPSTKESLIEGGAAKFFAETDAEIRASMDSGEGTPEPVVSVLVSTYASEKFLRACLEDLELQTIASKIEIIVIDSGSPENERAIVEEFQRRYSNIRYLRTERETLYAAWNRGVEMARGRYVTNANSDDSHRADALELLVAALEAHPEAGLAYGDYFNSSVPNDTFATPHVTRRIVQPDYHPAEVMFYCPTGCHPMWRRTVFDQIGPFDPNYTAPGDYEFLLRFVQAGLRAVHVPECLSLFYQNPQGLSWKSGRKSKYEWDVIQAKYRAEMPIERLFRVEAGDAGSKARGWVALGNLALGYKVPWLENASHDLDFGMTCYEAAVECDPDCTAAIHNLAVTLMLMGKVAEGETVMRRLPVEWLGKIEADIRRGRMELAKVDAAPAVEPLVYGRRVNRDERSAERDAIHAGGMVGGNPGRAEGPLRMPVRWVAAFHSAGEYAEDATELVVALSDSVDLATHDLMVDYSASYAASMSGSVKGVLERTGGKFNFVLDGIAISEHPGSQFSLPQGARFNIGRTTIDAERLPPKWARACNLMDEIWVPSQFALESFARSGVERDKLLVVPVSVDVESLEANVVPMQLAGRAAWNFLLDCEWSERAGWDVLLGAYLREFSRSDDVCLWILAHLPGKTVVESRERIQQAIRNHVATLHVDGEKQPRIEMIDVAHQDLPRLYRAMDCMVAPARGDGWGRVPMKAMGLGLPVIATDYGALKDFATESNSYPLAHELVEIRATEPELLHLRGLRWANPSEDHLRKLLRQVQQYPAEARERGSRARACVMELFSRETVVGQVVCRLRAIELQLTVPSCPPVKPRTPGQLPDESDCKRSPVLVAWEGSFLDLGSLSHVNREMTRGLGAQPGVKLACVGKNVLPAKVGPWPGMQEAARRLLAVPPKQTQVTVRHSWPPSWERPASGKWVMIQPWEYGALPLEWCEQLSRVDEIWVYSEYVRRAYVDSGVDPFKVKVVPLGIDPDRFQPSAPPLKLATGKSFKFLFVGGTIHRKGPDLLLKSYTESFTASDDVCLVIKDFGGESVYAGQTLEAQIRAAQSQPNAPEILYLNEELPPEALPGLYTACDCLVHPYRGEGFGLPVLEAMACGLPVVVTGGGATDDFATDDFAYRLPALREGIGASISGMKLVKPGWLLEPDSQALSERLRWIVTHRAESIEKGRAASEHVRAHWTWAQASEVAARRLRDLVATQEATSAIPARNVAKVITAPAVARVGNLWAAREMFKQEQLLAAWNETISAGLLRPYHPEALLLLAEIARAAGDLERAKALVGHARRLAPKWKAAQNGLKGPASKQVKRVELPPLMDSMLKLEAPTLTVCLITKNEERFLGRCLASIRGLAQQIVVVDTGSTDRTVEIAREHGAEVSSFEWCDDFGAARNAALERATGDWILVLDADEELPADQNENLRKLMRDASAMAFRLPMMDKGREEEGVSYLPRLFRNAPGLYFAGRIHEHAFGSVTARCQEWGLENKFGSARLLHHGYTAEMMRDRDKSRRNLALLQKALEETPGDPNLLMNLGLELTRCGRRHEGLEQYAAAFAALSALAKNQAAPELRESLLTQYASHLLAAEEHSAVIQVLNSTLAQSAGLTATMHWLAALACVQSGKFVEGAEHARRCLAKRNQPVLSPIHRDILKGGPNHCLALCLAALKQPDSAENAFQAALKDEPAARPVRYDYARFLADEGRELEALNLLHPLVAEDSSEVRVWELGARVALKKPEFLEFACDWTGEAIRMYPGQASVIEFRAEALLLSGKSEQALVLWKRLKPGSNPVHRAALIICEALRNEASQPVPEAIGARVSQEFIAWYRRLLGVNAAGTIHALHARIELLRRVIPEAVHWLEMALAEANPAPSRQIG